MSRHRKNQRDLLLALLISARSRDAEVALPEILELGIAQYSARIHELRKMGCQIENRIQRVDGVTRSWFRLKTGMPPITPTKQQQQTPADATLFGHLAKDRTYQE